MIESPVALLTSSRPWGAEGMENAGDFIGLRLNSSTNPTSDLKVMPLLQSDPLGIYIQSISSSRWKEALGRDLHEMDIR
jgi:hypothetical protein